LGTFADVCEATLHADCVVWGAVREIYTMPLMLRLLSLTKGEAWAGFVLRRAQDERESEMDLTRTILRRFAQQPPNGIRGFAYWNPQGDAPYV
jgi:hypothetical protein